MEQPNNASLIPTAAIDILLAVPRLAQRAGSYALFYVPEAFDNVAGKIFNGGSIIADATGQQTVNSTITNTSNQFAQHTATVLDAALREAWKEGSDETTSTVFGMMLHGFAKVKNFGGIFSYLTSRWALTTFGVAIILNRTQFYASSRERLRLKWYVRLGLYIGPICAFVFQLLRLLQAIKCQTSPDFALLRHGDPLKVLAIDFGGEGGFLHKLSSTLLFWQDDATACVARNMSLMAVEGEGALLRGSMSLLFPFFYSLCLAQFFETLFCALQGQQPMAETGMTIFEHSLAFAECEAMISSALGFGFFGQLKLDNAGSTGSSSSAPSTASGPLISRAEFLQRLNVPPEVLLVCLISCLSHLSSAILAVLGIRKNVRLFNTGVWAFCYMSAFMWSFIKVIVNPVESMIDLGVLRFPTVCIVGFIPHLMILIGIVICGWIYGLALLITALSVPEEVSAGMSFGQRFAWAYANLQANVQFSPASRIQIKMSEDFYTTLLKVGFATLTAASEAVYLNEGSRIHVAQMTWVEKKRVDELAMSLEKRNHPAIPSELLDDGIAKGVDYTDQMTIAATTSPYARERKSRPTRGDKEKVTSAEPDSGLGLAQRKNRMGLTIDFMAGMFWLVIGVQAQILLNTLRKIGIRYRPSWLLKAAGLSDSSRRMPVTIAPTRHFQALLGEYDDSGDYEASNTDDEDTTSMISMSTDASTSDEWSDVEDSGRRTPTQRDPYGNRDEDVTPFQDSLQLTELAALLNPRTAEDRDSALRLSHALLSPRPMTRSQYHKATAKSRSNLLTSMRRQPAPSAHTDEEEERDLELFILAQRAQTSLHPAQGGTWESGAEGMGAGGPQCVVCQSMPRTVMVWPCGCLSMCDDCRMGLAARNYSKCICCRTDIAAYSRLYVP